MNEVDLDKLANESIVPFSDETKEEITIDDSSYLTKDELNTLDFTKTLRLEILKKLSGNGTDIPDDSKTVRLINEVARELDTSILKLAEIRNKDKGDENADLGNLVSAIMDKMLTNMNNSNNSREIEELRNRELPEEFEISDAELVTGELDVEPEELTLEKLKKGIE